MIFPMNSNFKYYWKNSSLCYWLFLPLPLLDFKKVQKNKQNGQKSDIWQFSWKCVNTVNNEVCGSVKTFNFFWEKFKKFGEKCILWTLKGVLSFFLKSRLYTLSLVIILSNISSFFVLSFPKKPSKKHNPFFISFHWSSFFTNHIYW